MTFTEEEIETLKELAQERIYWRKCFPKLPYRNRFETWDDAYNNLKAMGMSHEKVIKQIGEKQCEHKVYAHCAVNHEETGSCNKCVECGKVW
mgnify:CR=1 FL=1